MSTTIKQFDKTNLDLLRKDINLALKSVEEKYGIHLKGGNISYDNLKFTLKVNARIVDQTHGIYAVEAERFDQYHELYNLPKDAMTKTYISTKGTPCKILGLSDSRKYPIVMQRLTDQSTFSCNKDFLNTFTIQ